MAPEGAGRLVARRYRLIRRLGRGGHGQVWLARDESLGVDVAVKEVWLPPALDEAEQAARLGRAEREARSMAGLREHPNIVPVYDIVIDEDKPWLVMRLIAGRSLAEHLAEHGPLAEDTARTVAEALLTALGAVHAAGLVHRDVKPANVLLTEDGQVLLTDFGLAIRQGEPQESTVLGTREYLAPERLRGKAGPGSDLFSLGVTLYRAVEGISPFRRELAAAVHHAIRFEEPPPMKRAGRLAPVIAGLLEKNPVRRLTVPKALAKLAEPPAEEPTLDGDSPREPAPPGPGGWPKKKVLAWVAGALSVPVALVLVYQSTRDDPGRAASPTPSPATTTPTSFSGIPDWRVMPSLTTTSLTTTSLTATGPAPASTTSPAEVTAPAPDTPDALLPRSFQDTHARYTRTSAGVRSCLGNGESDRARKVLREANCTQLVVGTYGDAAGTVLVSVLVLPLPSVAHADAANQGLLATQPGDLPPWCPTTGASAQVCDRDSSQETYSQFHRQDGRHLMISRALYVTRTFDPDSEPRLKAAAGRAADVAGPRASIR